MRLPFVKMEGAGNDYVFVDGIRHAFPLARGPELARAWSDRHFGIGGDGLIVLLAGDGAPVRMLMFNADGSRGAMCGNGLRCLAILAREHGHVATDRFAVATDAGVRRVELLRQAGIVLGARTEMGDVKVAAAPRTIAVAGREVTYWAGDAGNPHAVVFVDGDVETFPVVEVGAAMQRHAAFPDGVNVEFVRVEPDGTLWQRTFERGSGETMACGTGAAVAALAAVRTQRVRGPEVQVRLRGGVLAVRVGGAGEIVVAGPARVAFVGEVELG
jgi:diaminopimelate epimerase